jgi:hypothetical protein
VTTALVGGAYFTAILPIWGKYLYLDQSVPVWVSRAMEDAFGVGALLAIWILYRLRATDPGPLAAVPVPAPDRSAAESKVLAGSREA